MFDEYTIAIISSAGACSIIFTAGMFPPSPRTSCSAFPIAMIAVTLVWTINHLALCAVYIDGLKKEVIMSWLTFYRKKKEVGER